MKVVLFCGGLGMRLRDYSNTIPKPMVPLRYRPVLWHVMKYYAYWGHKDFIICLGYKGDVIKDYFLNYSECLSNDFVLSEGGRRVDLLRQDIADWRITFVDTGISTCIGERLLAVAPFLQGEEAFLANYSDGLTDCPLPAAIDHFHQSDTIASFLAVKPNQTFHVAEMDARSRVTAIQDIRTSNTWINGGFFMLRKEIFEHLQPGEELVVEAFARLIAKQQLTAFRYEGFWRAVDTFKDLQELENCLAEGDGPWEMWRRNERSAGAASTLIAPGLRRTRSHPPTVEPRRVNGRRKAAPSGDDLMP